MMETRRVLCFKDVSILPGVQLVTLVKLLARAIVEHLGDYAVVVDPGGTSYFYEPLDIHELILAPPLPRLMSKVEAEAFLVWDEIDDRVVHYLVVGDVGDAALAAFMEVPGACFDVVTPFIDYTQKFNPLPANMLSWLLATGRAMPAIRLPSSTGSNGETATFYTIDDGWNAQNPPERDACRLRLTPAQVNDAANEPDWASVNGATRATFERWARTVTWKRVGICISGGGASVFRLAPLFAALEAKGLPIDLLAGVSGGTVFAACYATGGMPKVYELANKGVSMTAAFMGSMVATCIVKDYMDKFFDGCGVNNTEIRMVALCMAIAPLSHPKATMVMDGSMGDAIVASGGAPFFAPYFDNNNTRQSDGASMAGLPPPFLAERFGADIIFAMNVLSLPKNRFPGEDNPIIGGVMSLLYRYTPLGRIADTWGATSTMLHTISEGAGLHADVFVDAAPRDWAPLEQALFYNSANYALDGVDWFNTNDLNDPNPPADVIDVNAIANDFVQRWRALT